MSSGVEFEGDQQPGAGYAPRRVQPQHSFSGAPLGGAAGDGASHRGTVIKLTVVVACLVASTVILYMTYGRPPAIPVPTPGAAALDRLSPAQQAALPPDVQTMLQRQQSRFDAIRRSNQ